MRLRDKRDGDAGVPPEVERELEAVDAAVRGGDALDGSDSLSALAVVLREDRPEPDPAFGAELDAWAAAGFPRGRRPGARAESRPGRSFERRFSLGGPRRWMPIAAAATGLVVVAAAVTQVSEFRQDGGPETSAPGPAVSEKPSPGVRGPETEDRDALVAPEAQDSAEEAAVDGRDDAGLQYFSADADRAALRNGSGGDRPGISRARDERKVERDAEMTLAAPVDEVPDVTNESIEVIESADGVVLNSQSTGTDRAAQSTIEAEVPTSKLDATLAQLSDLADVQSRTEKERDITTAFVGAKDRLIGLRAERDNLATRIREATTDAEVAALQAQLNGVNQEIAAARNDLAKVAVRADLSSITIQVTSDGARSGGDEDDGWSFGDALDDAGKVLEVGAGVALISAAVLVPLAIIAAVAFFVMGAANRRARERALDD